MAETVEIAPGSKPAKIRNPLAVALLTLVTVGIYGIFWWYFVNREMADLGRAKGTGELGDSPGKSVLAITLGALVIVPAIMGYINTFKRAQAAQRLSGQSDILNGWLALVLVLVISPAFYAYIQSGLNKVWEASGSAADAAPAPGAPAETPAAS